MIGELVRVGKGNKAHRLWGRRFTYCGQWGITNSKNVEGLPLCKTCQKLYEKEEKQCL